MNKILSLPILIFSLAITSGCSKNDDNVVSDSTPAPNSVPTNPGGNTNPQTGVSSLRYYKGGWLPAPNSPTFSHDFTIHFDQFKDAGFLLKAKNPDVLCSYPDASFTNDRATALFALANSAQASVSSGPTLADGGVEYFEITLQDARKFKYHLDVAAAPAGELYILQPKATEISNALKAIQTSLVQICQ